MCSINLLNMFVNAIKMLYVNRKMKYYNTLEHNLFVSFDVMLFFPPYLCKHTSFVIYN